MKNMSAISKILILMLVLTGISMAAPVYYFHVESPEIADSYFNIFNGIAKIFGSEDYLGLLRLVFLFGGFFVFIAGVIDSWGKSAGGAVSGYFKYLIGGVAVLSIMFSHNTTMVIKVDNIPSYCTPGTSTTAGTVIDNIPEVLAYAFNFTNRFGREMTRLAELAYITPNANGSNSMHDSDGYIGALKQSLNLLSIDINKVTLSERKNSEEPAGSTYAVNRPPYDLGRLSRTIFSQCILVPFSAKGISGQDEITTLKSSGDIFKYLNELYTTNRSIGGLAAAEYTAVMGGEVWKCGDLWNYVKPYYTQFRQDAVCQKGIGAAAVTLITGAGSPPVSDFQDVAIQAGLVSELANTASQLGVGVSGMSYASGKTRAEFVQSNMATGEYMAEMLPYLQMTIRAVLYAFLPFVFVIVLLPGGIKVITQYLQTIIWVELWSPTAAILNMFITQQAEYRISSEYASNGITVTNAIDMLSTGSTIAGVAGYLYASVPALTWLILKGSAHMLAGIGGAVAAGMGQNIQTQSMNQDAQTVKQNQVFKNRTGEEFSIAETQHFEALKMGASSGGTLAAEKTAGLENVANAAAFSKAKELASADTAIKGLGGGPMGAGVMSGQGEAVNTITSAKGAAPMTNTDGTLSKRGKKVVQQDAQVLQSEQKAKVENPLTEETTDNAAALDRSQKFNKASAAVEQTMKSTGKNRVGAAKYMAKIEGVNQSMTAAKIDKGTELKTGSRSDNQTSKTAKAGVKRVEAEAVAENYNTLSGISKVTKLEGTLDPGTHGKITAAGELQNLGKVSITSQVLNGKDYTASADSAVVSRARPDGSTESGIWIKDKNGKLVLANGADKSAGIVHEQQARHSIQETETGRKIMKQIDGLNDFLSLSRGALAAIGITGGIAAMGIKVGSKQYAKIAAQAAKTGNTQLLNRFMSARKAIMTGMNGMSAGDTLSTKVQDYMDTSSKNALHSNGTDYGPRISNTNAGKSTIEENRFSMSSVYKAK